VDKNFSNSNFCVLRTSTSNSFDSAERRFDAFFSKVSKDRSRTSFDAFFSKDLSPTSFGAFVSKDLSLTSAADRAINSLFGCFDRSGDFVFFA
jgi:hypothetical protein